MLSTGRDFAGIQQLVYLRDSGPRVSAVVCLAMASSGALSAKGPSQADRVAIVEGNSDILLLHHVADGAVATVCEAVL